MSGFLQKLEGPVYIVRTGPRAEKYGDPYMYACVVNVRDGVPVFMAYNSQPPTADAIKAAARLFETMGYKEITYERAGESPILTRVIFGPQGEMTMKHDKIHAPHAGHAPRDSSGKPDQATILGMTRTMCDQIESGHYSIDDGGQVDSANNSHEDERALTQAMRRLKPNQRLLWFVRGETDPSA